MNKVKLAGLAMVLPILALSGPAFAQSVPVHVSTPVVATTRVLPPVNHGALTAPVGDPGMPIVGNLPAALLHNLPLSAAQLNQTISIVNSHLAVSAQGMVAVTPSVLKTAGLTNQEIHWAQTQMSLYNNKIATGAIVPIATSSQSMSLTDAQSNESVTLIRPMSTGNLSYGWYIANAPYVYTANYWWGQSTIFNELATSKTEGVLWVLDGTSAGIALAATKLSFIPYSDAVALLTTLGAVGFTIEAGAMQAADNGYGDHFNELWSGVPLGLYGNTP